MRVEFMLCIEFIVVACSVGRCEGRRMNEPNPGLALWKRCIMLSDWLRVGEDDVLCST